MVPRHGSNRRIVENPVLLLEIVNSDLHGKKILGIQTWIQVLWLVYISVTSCQADCSFKNSKHFCHLSRLDFLCCLYFCIISLHYEIKLYHCTLSYRSTLRNLHFTQNWFLHQGGLNRTFSQLLRHQRSQFHDGFDF